MNNLEVTFAKFTPGNLPVIAFVDLIINDGLAIHGIRLVDHKDKILICMPTRIQNIQCKMCKHKNPVTGKYCGHCRTAIPFEEMDRHYLDVLHPINQEVRTSLENQILTFYSKWIEKAA